MLAFRAANRLFICHFCSNRLILRRIYCLNISKKFGLAAQMQSNFNWNAIIFFLILEETARVSKVFSSRSQHSLTFLQDRHPNSTGPLAKDTLQLVSLITVKLRTEAVQPISETYSARCTTCRRKQYITNTFINSIFFIYQQLWCSDCSLIYNYHSQGVKASSRQQMSQIRDSSERWYMRRKSPFPLQFC